MFQDKNIFEVIHAGGFTMYVLIICSILSIAVIIERLWYFKRRSSIFHLDLLEGALRKDVVHLRKIVLIGRRVIEVPVPEVEQQVDSV